MIVEYLANWIMLNSHCDKFALANLTGCHCINNVLSMIISTAYGSLPSNLACLLFRFVLQVLSWYSPFDHSFLTYMPSSEEMRTSTAVLSSLRQLLLPLLRTIANAFRETKRKYQLM